MIQYLKTRLINVPDILVAFANLARNASKCGLVVGFGSFSFRNSVSPVTGLGNTVVAEIIGGGGVGGLVIVFLLPVGGETVTTVIGAAVVTGDINGGSCLKSTSSFPNNL